MPRKVRYGGFAGQLFHEAPELLRRSLKARGPVRIETEGLRKSGVRVVVNRGMFGDELTVQFKPGVFDFKAFSSTLKRLLSDEPTRGNIGKWVDKVTGAKKRRVAEEKFLAEWGSSEHKKGYVKVAGKEYFAVFKHTASGVQLEFYSLNPITKSPTSLSVTTPKIFEVNYDKSGITSVTFWKPYKEETAHLMKLALNAELVKQAPPA